MSPALSEAIAGIKRAFGSPGDHGYNTKEGQALYCLYAAEVQDSFPQPSSDHLVDQLADIFEEIAKGKGRFSADWKQHANNTIEAMRALAKAGAKKARARDLTPVAALIVDAYADAEAPP